MKRPRGLRKSQQEQPVQVSKIEDKTSTELTNGSSSADNATILKKVKLTNEDYQQEQFDGQYAESIATMMIPLKNTQQEQRQEGQGDQNDEVNPETGLSDYQELCLLYDHMVNFQGKDPNDLVSLMNGIVHECDRMLRMAHFFEDHQQESNQESNSLKFEEKSTLPPRFHAIYSAALLGITEGLLNNSYAGEKEEEDQPSQVKDYLDAVIERVDIGLDQLKDQEQQRQKEDSTANTTQSVKQSSDDFLLFNSLKFKARLFKNEIEDNSEFESKQCLFQEYTEIFPVSTMLVSSELEMKDRKEIINLQNEKKLYQFSVLETLVELSDNKSLEDKVEVLNFVASQYESCLPTGLHELNAGKKFKEIEFPFDNQVDELVLETLIGAGSTYLALTNTFCEMFERDEDEDSIQGYIKMNVASKKAVSVFERALDIGTKLNHDVIYIHRLIGEAFVQKGVAVEYFASVTSNDEMVSNNLDADYYYTNAFQHLCKVHQHDPEDEFVSDFLEKWKNDMEDSGDEAEL